MTDHDEYQSPVVIQRPAPVAQRDSLTYTIWIPLLISAITSLLIAMAATWLSFLIGLPFEHLEVFVTAFLLAMVANWLLSVRSWILRFERLLGFDLDGDGLVGARLSELHDRLEALQLREERPQEIRLTIENPTKGRITFLDLEDPDGTLTRKLRILFRSLLSGDSLAINKWSPVFGRDVFESIRKQLIDRGFAAERNPNADNSPVYLTEQGRGLAKAFLEQPESFQTGTNGKPNSSPTTPAWERWTEM